MAKAKKKNVHVGGEQLPMFTPASDWVRPRELPDLRACKMIALDRETRDDGLNKNKGPGWAFLGSQWGGHVCGTSVAWREGGAMRSAYFPILHAGEGEDNFDHDQLRRWEIDHQKAGVQFVMQNAPYDVGWGEAYLGVPLPPAVHDVTCMANMVDEKRLSYELNSICRWLGVPGKDEKLLKEAASVFGYYGDDVKKNMWRLPSRYVGPYAEADAASTLLCAEKLLPMIEEQKTGAAYQLEMDLLPVVHAMRKRGLRVDLDAAERARREFHRKSVAVLLELSDKLGHTVSIENLRSNSWLEMVHDAQGIKYPRDPQTGKSSFDKKAWMGAHPHWLPKLIIKAKSLHDAAEKFVGTFILDFAHGDRIHPSINQFRSEDGGTRTFRFSYADPPLQQSPNREEAIATLVRGVFLPEDGDLWLAADYSQQEYRLIVHYAELLGCTRGAEAAERYRRDPRTDFHSFVAEMTGLERKPAKDVNFAKSYGAGIGKFAVMINKTPEEAAEIMKQYDENMPFNSELFQKLEARAQKVGYVRLLDGARIHFDTWEPTWLSREDRARGWGSGGKYLMGDCSLDEAWARCSDQDHPWYGKRLRRAHTRKALNALIQGGAARQTKLAMRECWRAGIVPIIQMHDELGFSVSSEAQGAEATRIMREVVQLRVPMVVDAEYGPTWGRAKYGWQEAMTLAKAA